jgi:gliding motility-associated-like protein
VKYASQLHIKFRIPLIFVVLLFANLSKAQSVTHAYRFDSKFKVAQPGCGPELSTVKAAGTCSVGDPSGTFVDDALPCGVSRKVYHTNTNWGLKYENPAGTIKDNYTIQMYVKVTDWGKTWARIIDFSDGKLDQGIYFKSKNGSADRCIDFYPSGIAGDCPFFNTSTYYLLTFTRNGQTGMMDVYVDNKLFVSYNDSQGRYVAKNGVPIYIFRDDAEVPCESGAANFAFLSFSNQFSSASDVSKAFSEICFVANINASADFSVVPNPACDFSKNIVVNYTGDISSAGAGTTTEKNTGSGYILSRSDYTFEWDWGGGTTISGRGLGPFEVKWPSKGIKTVKLTITSTTCPDNKIVNIKTVLVTNLEVTAVWQDATCAEKGKITLKALEGTAPFEYSVDSLNFQNDPVFLVDANTYKITIRDSNNCVSTKSLVIDGPANIDLSTIKDSSICAGQKIKLVTSSNATRFTWEPAAGLDNANSQNPIANPSATTRYIVTASKDNCAEKRDTVLITVVPAITVQVTPDTEIDPGTPFQLYAFSPELAGKPGTNYQWLPPQGLNNNEIADPVATISEDISYTANIISREGCSGTRTVRLSVSEPASIFVPDVFTPNADGINEQLSPEIGKDFTLQYFRIYNRWGELIFISEKSGTGWDGMFKGSPVVPGQYVYKLTVLSPRKRVVKKEGTVLLIR